MMVYIYTIMSPLSHSPITGGKSRRREHKKGGKSKRSHKAHNKTARKTKKDKKSKK